MPRDRKSLPHNSLVTNGLCCHNVKADATSRLLITLDLRMRSTLFFIPHEFANLTVFGCGWLLIALAVACAGWIARTVWSHKRQTSAGKETDLVAEIVSGLPIWGSGRCVGRVFVTQY